MIPEWMKRDPGALRYLTSEKIYQDSAGHFWRVSSLTTGQRGDVAHLRSMEARNRGRNVPLARLETEYRQPAEA